MADGVQDEGIKISAPYYDVKSAGDANLIFSSSFPSLPIGKEFNTTISNFGSATLNHGMGFPPLIRVWAKLANGKTYQMDDALQFDSNTMIISNYYDQVVAFHIKVYAIDISVTVDYPFIQQPQGVQSTYDKNYGIKLSKEGYSVNDPDLRNFIIHSRTRSPLVLHIEASKDTNNTKTITYTNPASYVPWVMAFGSTLLNGDSAKPGYTPAIIGSQAYPRLNIDFTTSQVSVQSLPDQGGLASLVILRDPLFAGKQVDVVY